jgi:hypothetical protein
MPTPSFSGDIGSITGSGPTGGAPPAGVPLDATAGADLSANLALGESGAAANTGLSITGQGTEGFGTSAPTQGGDALPPISVPGAGAAAPTGGTDLVAGAVNDLPVPPTPPATAGGAGAAPPSFSGSESLGATGGTPAASAPTAPPAPAPTSAIGKFLADPGFSTGGDALSANAGWLVPAATLGYTALNANKGLSGVPGYNQLSGQAAALNTQGQQLQSYLNTGTLPPGVQSSLTSAGKSAKAAIRSQYASRGMSGSSAEAADLAHVDQTIVSSGVNIATNLLAQGVSEQNLSAQLYQHILTANLQSDAQLGTALGTLAAGAARPTIQVQAAR